MWAQPFMGPLQAPVEGDGSWDHSTGASKPHASANIFKLFVVNITVLVDLIFFLTFAICNVS
jgi:hypothetical protein